MTAAGEPVRRTLTTPDGRQLEFLTAGPADGMPLVFHTGTPGGLTVYEPAVRAAADRGLRVVQYSRPGYGRSAAKPGRLVADAAADVAAVLDQLGAGEFVTAGWSGGGPHALACAALLAGRCRAAASIAGIAPSDADGLDWLAGMAPENHDEFAAAAAGPQALSGFLAGPAAELAGVTAGTVASGLGELVSETDMAALTGDFAEYLAASFSTSVSAGIAGWRDDDLAFTRGWGFAVADCAATPVVIWQGSEDRMVPYSHGEWLAARIPGARARLLPGEGHLTLAVTSFGRIIDDVIDLSGLPR